MNYEIIDNFLPRSELKKIKSFIENRDFPWSFIEHKVDFNDDLKKYCSFDHLIYDYNVPISTTFDIIHPILNKIEFRSLLKINATMQVIGESIIQSKPITDHPFPHITAIYYLNNSDGFTTILDNELEIENVENRMVIFESSPYTQTNCTSTHRKTNIIFNYF